MSAGKRRLFNQRDASTRDTPPTSGEVAAQQVLVMVMYYCNTVRAKLLDDGVHDCEVCTFRVLKESFLPCAGQLACLQIGSGRE